MNRILKCDKYRITQYFSSKHKGIDIVKYYSSTCPIVAHTDGEVVWLQTGQKHNNNLKPGTNATYGNCVKLKHSNGYYTLYAHMKDVYVKKGQKVKRGQEIGYMGNTGVATGNHLHWEVRKPNETRINPEPYINADLPDMKKEKYYQVYDNVKNEWLSKVIIGNKKYAGKFSNAISCFRTEEADEYCAYDMVKKKWLPVVKGFKDYAGNKKNNLGAIAIKSNKLKYRVHIKERNKWLGWITGYDINDYYKGYAGTEKEAIDGIEIAYK